MPARRREVGRGKKRNLRMIKYLFTLSGYTYPKGSICKVPKK